MRADWEDRARTNPWYFTNSATENWTREEYFATGEENIAQYIESDLDNIAQGADPKQLRILEIGCGAGRMTRALARVFGEVHAIDLSAEMVRLCRENTAACGNVHVHQNNGMDLEPVHHLQFDFALSFIVFQHIPSKQIVEGYIREVRRVLKPGHLFKFQVQGVFTEGYDPTDTWHGAGFTEEEIRAIAARTGFELRYAHGHHSQEYWLWFFALIQCRCYSNPSPMHRRQFLTTLAATALAAKSKTAPNIVVILADDLGFGDVQFQNPRGKIPTPNIDSLARQGMAFTDAHSGSAVCSPTRYGLLTGRYAWRSTLQKGVLQPYDPPLIPPTRLTLPALLRTKGYRTACIGKWHLGWNWPRTAGQPRFDGPIPGGPTAIGFDSYFGTDVPNYPPYCFLENDRTVGIPSIPKPKSMFGTDGIMLPGWQLERILPTLVDRAAAFIQDSAHRRQPFFLYMPLTSPHTPLAVAPEWRGRSGLGLYGDWVMQTDAAVGDVLKSLESSGAAPNTLVLFTSDNGCAPYVVASPDSARGHYPSAGWRGYKSDIWEGGHRVPFIARWPGHIQPGSHSDALICLTDLMATCADLSRARIPASAAEDSVSFLPALTGGRQKERPPVIHHSIQGKFAIRHGRWKLALCPGSGGWSEPTDQHAADQRLPSIQLYDLEADPAERTNLAIRRSTEVAMLTAMLGHMVDNGRSTAGPRQANDDAIDIWKKTPAKPSASD